MNAGQGRSTLGAATFTSIVVQREGEPVLVAGVGMCAFVGILKCFAFASGALGRGRGEEERR